MLLNIPSLGMKRETTNVVEDKKPAAETSTAAFQVFEVEKPPNKATAQAVKKKVSYEDVACCRKTAQRSVKGL
ncbi:hypothetical protein SLE2022_273600 [Rubroshorea leprosula]